MNSSDLVKDTEALFCAIGHTVVRFQQVEQWLAEDLASLLSMRERDDQYLVSASMSFRQKVDLFVELFPRRTDRGSGFPKIEIAEVRKAFNAAEEFRNRVVHSFYAVEGFAGSPQWVRVKGSVRGKGGFSLNSTKTNIRIFEECNEALGVIRDWEFCQLETLQAATLKLVAHVRG